MNNIMVAKTSSIISLLKNGEKYGRYGCIALGLYFLHDWGVKAIDKNYAFVVSFNPEGKVDFNFAPSIVAENNS